MMKTVNLLVGVALVGGGPAVPLGAIEVQPETVKAWDEYIQRADIRIQTRTDGRQPFLWTDEAPDRGLRVRRGDVVIAPMAGHGSQRAPCGVIHHWIGAGFIPNATIGSLIQIIHDYNAHRSDRPGCRRA